MKLVEARQLMEECARDRVEAQMQMQTARAKSESATLIIQGILRRFPELREEAPSSFDRDWEFRVTDAPTGSEAALQIMQVDEGQGYTVREMVAALEERGWLPQSDNPPNAVRTTLERLTAQRIGVGKGRNNEGVVTYWYDEPAKSGYGVDEEPF